MRHILAGVCSVQHTLRDTQVVTPRSRQPGAAVALSAASTRTATAEVIDQRLIGRDISLHALGAILTTFGVRRVEASRSGRGATGRAGVGSAASAASIVRALAALNSLQIAHAACVFSGSACSECSRA